jgi:hypothetical protein
MKGIKRLLMIIAVACWGVLALRAQPAANVNGVFIVAGNGAQDLLEINRVQIVGAFVLNNGSGTAELTQTVNGNPPPVSSIWSVAYTLNASGLSTMALSNGNALKSYSFVISGTDPGTGTANNIDLRETDGSQFVHLTGERTFIPPGCCNATTLAGVSFTGGANADDGAVGTNDAVSVLTFQADGSFGENGNEDDNGGQSSFSAQGTFQSVANARFVYRSVEAGAARNMVIYPVWDSGFKIRSLYVLHSTARFDSWQYRPIQFL